MRREKSRRPFPDTTGRSATDVTVLLSSRESGRDGVKVGESDVRGGGVDWIGGEVDSQLSLSRESSVLRLLKSSQSSATTEQRGAAHFGVSIELDRTSSRRPVLTNSERNETVNRLDRKLLQRARPRRKEEIRSRSVELSEEVVVINVADRKSVDLKRLNFNSSFRVCRRDSSVQIRMRRDDGLTLAIPSVRMSSIERLEILVVVVLTDFDSRSGEVENHLSNSAVRFDSSVPTTRERRKVGNGPSDRLLKFGGSLQGDV